MRGMAAKPDRAGGDRRAMSMRASASRGGLRYRRSPYFRDYEGDEMKTITSFLGLFLGGIGMGWVTVHWERWGWLDRPSSLIMGFYSGDDRMVGMYSY